VNARFTPGLGHAMPGMSERGQVWAADGRFLPPPEVTGAGGRVAISNGELTDRIDHNGTGNEGTERGRPRGPISGVKRTFSKRLSSLLR
jgi:hypothetical protein